MDHTKFRLRSFTTLESRYLLECGSYHELPLKYCAANLTDLDGMHCYFDICAIPWNRNPPKNTRCTVLRIDSKQTPPGFAKLEVDREMLTYFRRPPLLSNIKTGGPSVLCKPRITDEGRAFLKVNQNEITEDAVFAVCCPYWPLEAEEWRKRKRFNGWPNEKLIARITRGGCHFVSKLRTWSSCDDTEWRFSFSKAELLLIHSWTSEQKFAYHAIRVFKGRISKHCDFEGNKGIQTYYFKTLMLWACEEFSPEFWSEQNMKTCVETLLRRFFRCLEEKFCPSYFIPDCNIMSHLKDEGSFEGELRTLQIYMQIFLRHGISIVAKDCTSTNEMVTELPFEYKCLDSMSYSFPLNEELNGRCAQYLSECEWFLPGMKNVHAAIEANLRLMSVDSVTERQASEDYVVCVKNFDFALLKGGEFEPYEFLKPDKSFPENWMRIFVRKLFRNSVAVYCRKDRNDNALVNMIKKSYPSFLHGVTAAYRANFYLTAMQSYKESLSECKKCFEVLHSKAEVGAIYHDASVLSSYLPLLICNSLSQIFDEHLQILLGFATLHRNISFSNSPIIATSNEVCLKLDAWEFLKYICIQCQQKLYSVSELTDSSSSANSDFFRPYMSQLMDNATHSAVILFSSLRLSRAYKNSLMGHRIPDPFCQRKYQTIQRMQ